MNKQNIATGIAAIAPLFGLLAIVVIIGYSIQNDSGHTGFNPYLALFVFVPIAVAGILHLTILRGGYTSR